MNFDNIPNLSGFGNASAFSWEAMMKTSDITVPVQKHLSKVYTALLACMCAAAAGCYAHIIYGFGSNSTPLFMLAAIGILMYMHYDQKKEDTFRRTALLCGFGFCKGLGVASLVHYALYMDPNIVAISILGTLVIFGCFALTALLSQRRSYLYLGGFISSALMVLSLASIGNMFFKSEMLQNLHIQGGLLVFCGIVIFDTQLIVEAASAGSRDFAGHAANLFVDIIAIFVRVLLILMKQRERSDDEKRRNKNRR